MQTVGKLLMGLAVVLFVSGGLIWLLGRFGGGFLPGDIVFRRGNTTIVFPVVTMLIVFIVLTVVLNLFFRR